MINEIPNDALDIGQIPPEDGTWEEFQEFALSFNGYEYWGFDRCAEIANAKLGRNLTELRTCLFFEQRRWRHFGWEPDPDALEYIRSLIRQIRDHVARSED